MTPATKRYAVITFLVAAIALPVVPVALEAMPDPWFRIACWAIVAFILVWVWLMVRSIGKR
ncbi:hypothetical protein [Mycolicibacterium sediminis]|uniref:Uncharacterized protein n=1 Tax=Mycolicibacterium sediminis TaxID=1286180 RepID=A0A7I7QK19_9MYCO|nr:hypothetical protein [Mycolicibacterium sediminis]BBY26634.1 hypothetical protein MSEDJ_07300 [Mycolicibacterium sediminis]